MCADITAETKTWPCIEEASQLGNFFAIILMKRLLLLNADGFLSFKIFRDILFCLSISGSTGVRNKLSKIKSTSTSVE